MKQDISHNNIPEALTWLLDKVNNIEDLLIQSGLNNKPQNAKEIYTADETAKMLNITLPTLHNWVRDGKIIKYKIGGHRIGFKSADVDRLLFKVEGKRR